MFISFIIFFIILILTILIVKKDIENIYKERLSKTILSIGQNSLAQQYLSTKHEDCNLLVCITFKDGVMVKDLLEDNI